MPSVARATPTSEQTRAEIERAFGFLPPFFEPALSTPQVLDNLWQQTLSAYVQNPLSALFKERLNALLSRFCTAPYCMIVHSSALRPLGMTAWQVLTLLDAPPPDQETAPPLESLPTPSSEEAAAPSPDSPLEKTLLYCATAVFLERADAPACQAELGRLLGPELYPHLVAYLAYIKTCHTWIEAHPHVSYEADRRAQDNLGPLLAEEPALADFFRDYHARVRAQGLGRERRRAAGETLRAEQARTARILDSVTDAFFTLDHEFRFTFVNRQAESMWGKARAELLGRSAWDVFPDSVDGPFYHQYHRVMGGGGPESMEEFYPLLGAWLDVRAFPSPDGISVFFQDVTGRKARETERERQAERERFLADLAERARVLTDPDEVVADALRSVGGFLGASRCVFVDIEADGGGGGGGGAITIHPDYRADDTVVSMAGVFPITAFGGFVIDAYAQGRTVVVDDVRRDRLRVPEESRAAYEGAGILAHVGAPVVHSARLVSCIGVHSPVPRHWTPEEVALVQAVVERTWLTVEVLRQQRALARGAEATTRILESITDAFFTLDHDYRFTYVNSEAARVLFRTRAELSGRYIWEVFAEGKDSTFDQQYRHALSEGVAVSFEEFYPPLNFWLEVRAFPSPDGLSVYFRDISERKAAEAERERLLAEERMRAEREALLNRVGQALRASAAPEIIQERAANLLGEALGADRCFYVTYTPAHDQAQVSQDWRRDDLPSQAGTYRASNFAPLLRELFPASRTAVIDDVRAALSPASAAVFEATQHRAVLVVPFFDGGSLVASLYVSMADAPRTWTREEVALAEQVATLTRTSLEAALVQEREHRIAEQLQGALQPTLPEHVPGLAVGKFTRPALNEAQIGGDFYDIFPLDKELYALVIGDVSGKGLAAAQQLALIRNSLRTTLYLYRAPAQAAGALNRIVTSHDLLVGFVTAWVGVYDAATGRINYCSCGHEPGLIRRTDASIEALETAGPPLGVSENAEYHESTVTLSSGDTLLLYTDGISESGPNRRRMLGTDGVARLLGSLPDAPDPQAQAEALIGAVSDYTNGVFRDDVALLFARRQ